MLITWLQRILLGKNIFTYSEINTVNIIIVFNLQAEIWTCSLPDMKRDFAFKELLSQKGVKLKLSVIKICNISFHQI